MDFHFLFIIFKGLNQLSKLFKPLNNYGQKINQDTISIKCCSKQLHSLKIGSSILYSFVNFLFFNAYVILSFYFIQFRTVLTVFFFVAKTFLF